MMRPTTGDFPGIRKETALYAMEEEKQEELAENVPSRPEVKSEQSNKPRDVRLPLPGSLQEIVGSLLFASETPLSAADLRECIRGVTPDEGDDADVLEFNGPAVEADQVIQDFVGFAAGHEEDYFDEDL